jgi:hypothetical protein
MPEPQPLRLGFQPKLDGARDCALDLGGRGGGFSARGGCAEGKQQ